MRKVLGWALFVLMCAATLFAQQVLNNDSVVKLVKSGLSEDMVVNIVKSEPGKYSVTPDDIIALKNAGVSEKIITAMLAKGGASGDAATAAAPGATGAAAPPAGLPTDVGVYWDQKDNWSQLLPEAVNWQTGGVLKSIGTVGVVKGDVNGRVYGSHSKTAVAVPAQFLFHLAEGTEITEYQLIHFRDHGDSREFRTVTGGVFHVSGGAKRDLMDFSFKKVADRMYTVDLPQLSAGEYGFLAPGSAMQSHASAQLGKIYTFRVLE